LNTPKVEVFFKNNDNAGACQRLINRITNRTSEWHNTSCVESLQLVPIIN